MTNDDINKDISDAFAQLESVEKQLVLLKTQFRGLRTRLGDTAAPARDLELTKRDRMLELANVADVIDTSIGLLENGPVSGGDMVKQLYEMLSASPKMAALGSDVLLERARNIAQAYLGRVVGEP